MYRVKKVLNNNTVIGIHVDNNQEYLIMGKGIGFGKKISERFSCRADDTVYSLQASTERGDFREMACTIQPVFLEIAGQILDEAEKVFQTIDRNILFPMADHIEFAVKRIRNNEQISNPLTDDIRVLFYMEFKTAECIRTILKEKMDIEICDDEISYIALHIHSAIQDEKISEAMQMAKTVRECISLVEQKTGRPIDVMSLSYNRLMNHVRYMIARTLSGEKLKLNMNDYMLVKFPQSFQLAKFICDETGRSLKKKLSEAEIGYLAMHIERVASDVLGYESVE